MHYCPSLAGISITSYVVHGMSWHPVSTQPAEFFSRGRKYVMGIFRLASTHASSREGELEMGSM